jgi:hypothetical protein
MLLTDVLIYGGGLTLLLTLLGVLWVLGLLAMLEDLRPPPPPAGAPKTSRPGPE